LPRSPRWLVAHARSAEAEEIVARAESASGERVGELPPPLPATAEPVEERFPTIALLWRPYFARLVLFAGIRFVYYVGNYAWLTLAPAIVLGVRSAAGFSGAFTAMAVSGFLTAVLVTLAVRATGRPL